MSGDKRQQRRIQEKTHKCKKRRTNQKATGSKNRMGNRCRTDVRTEREGKTHTYIHEGGTTTPTTTTQRQEVECKT